MLLSGIVILRVKSFILPVNDGIAGNIVAGDIWRTRQLTGCRTNGAKTAGVLWSGELVPEPTAPELGLKMSELAGSALGLTMPVLNLPVWKQVPEIEPARAGRPDSLPGRTVPKLPEFSCLCN